MEKRKRGRPKLGPYEKKRKKRNRGRPTSNFEGVVIRVTPKVRATLETLKQQMNENSINSVVEFILSEAIKNASSRDSK
jgi:hypothetical protein